MSDEERALLDHCKSRLHRLPEAYIEDFEALITLTERLTATGAERYPALERVLEEIRAERQRQDVKWDPSRTEDHPDADPVLARRPGGCTPARLAEELEIPSEPRAKYMCQTAADRGQTSWPVILVEELAEAVHQAANDFAPGLRRELVQVAAVSVRWIEAIDRRPMTNCESCGNKVPRDLVGQNHKLPWGGLCRTEQP